jgi:methionine-rich copper-binding protein CopC
VIETYREKESHIMKLLKFGAVAAVLATMSLVGCSADKSPEASEKSSSISFHLKTSGGVQIDAVNYDLTTTPSGADVVNGTLPVPDDQSTNIPLLGISSLGAGTYALDFTATSTDGKYVCDSGKVAFTLAAGQSLALPTINLQCSTTVQVDTTGNVSATVSVTTAQQTVGSVIETFTYGPITANGQEVNNACVFAPITLKVAAKDPTIAYSWGATPDGTFTLNATNTAGTYNCASGGTKTLTLTGVQGGTTSTKQVSVSCNDAGCTPPVCGNGIKETGEACDDTTPRCQNCQIVPVCGDGIVDAPEQCDALVLPTATCSATCQTIVVTPVCGDGIVNQASEQCDNGVNNSNTAPNACRTNCTLPKCGDNVVDTGETCDPPGTATCDATCQTIIPPRDVACIACIEADPIAGPIQATYVDGDANALLVEKCAINKDCFNPLAAVCFCGPTDSTGATDVAVCSTSTFTAAGPCATEIHTASPGATNDDILNAYFDFGTSSGAAMGTLNATLANAPQCTTQCF